MSVIVDYINIADEVFIATALLHREHPYRDDFTVQEIVSRVSEENLYGRLRPGIQTDASRHCVANKPANPAKLRMLNATRSGSRRLLNATADRHPGRTGKTWPALDEVPAEYDDLIRWAMKRYGPEKSTEAERWLGGVLSMRGLGQDLWSDENADAYVRKLREPWE